MLRPAEVGSEALKKICERIKSAEEPVARRIQPEADCVPLDCFDNVRKTTERVGGTIQFGWSIWEWPNVFIEAEHHAVHSSADGLIQQDVTPASGSETYRVFLPDSSAIYDFDNKRTRTDNIRVAISDDARILEFFECAASINRILSGVPGFGEVVLSEQDSREYRRIVGRQAHLQFELAMDYTPRNAQCFCGSGRKFKRYHGQS